MTTTKTTSTAAKAPKATKVVTRPEAAPKRTTKPAAATKDVGAATKVKPSTRSQAKATKAAPVEAPVEAPVDVASMDRVERINTAKVEARLMREWKAGDRSTEPPATPVLDWMADPTNDITKVTRKSSGERAPRQPKDAELLARTVEFVKTRRADGMSWYTIATALNDEGIKTQKGATWYYSTVTLFAKQNAID